MFASDDLKKHEEPSGDNKSKDIRNLQDEIDDLSSSLKEKDMSVDALEKTQSKISSLWSKAIKCFK